MINAFLRLIIYFVKAYRRTSVSLTIYDEWAKYHDLYYTDFPKNPSEIFSLNRTIFPETLSTYTKLNYFMQSSLQLCNIFHFSKKLGSVPENMTFKSDRKWATGRLGSENALQNGLFHTSSVTPLCSKLYSTRFIDYYFSGMVLFTFFK